MKKRLSTANGSIALEALLSMIIMLVAFYALWGVVVIIYNQSQITTAAQFASQTAVNSFLAVDPYVGTASHQSAIKRDPGRQYGQGSPPCVMSGFSNTLYGFANCVAKNQAEFIFTDNTRSLFPDQFTGSAPVEIQSNTTTFSCIGNDKPWLVSGGTNNNFATSCMSADSATAIRATFSAPTILSKIQFLGLSSNGLDTNKTGLEDKQSNLATATRYQPK